MWGQGLSIHGAPGLGLLEERDDGQMGSDLVASGMKANDQLEMDDLSPMDRHSLPSTW